MRYEKYDHEKRNEIDKLLLHIFCNVSFCLDNEPVVKKLLKLIPLRCLYQSNKNEIRVVNVIWEDRYQVNYEISRDVDFGYLKWFCDLIMFLVYNDKKVGKNCDDLDKYDIIEPFLVMYKVFINLIPPKKPVVAGQKQWYHEIKIPSHSYNKPEIYQPLIIWLYHRIIYYRFDLFPICILIIWIIKFIFI